MAARSAAASLLEAAARAFWRHQRRMRGDAAYREYVVRLVSQRLYRLGASRLAEMLQVLFRIYMAATMSATSRYAYR
jgi:hypothetical protein